MSKKLFIFIGIILVLFLFALIGYHFIISGNNDVSSGKPLSFKNFFPFGGATPQGERSTTTPQVPEEIQRNSLDYTKKLRLLSREPVSGAGILDTKAGSIVRHVEKATGHIFETELFSAVQNRISNTTIPLIYDATWTSDTHSLIAQYLSDDNQSIQTYSLTLKAGTSTENTLSGTLINGNVSSYSIFNSLLFSLVSTRGGSQGFVSNIDGSKKKEVWNSPIREFNSQFVNANTVALTTKPSEQANGFLYTVNTSNGQVKKILGNIAGLLTLVSPDAKRVLFSAQVNRVEMYVEDIEKGGVTRLTPSTFPEKCVWSKKDAFTLYCAVPEETLGSTSLTDWYTGEITFTDNIWKYDLKNNTSQIISQISSDGGEVVDVIKPIISDNDHYIVFINKKNGSLWSLDLTK